MYSLKITIFCIITCNGLSFAFPQNWPSSPDSKQGIDWQGKGSKSSNRGFGGDGDAEMIPSNILEKHQDYNVVRYPASKWVCTKETVDVNDDTMKDWRTTFNDDPMAAMRASKKFNRPSSKMFKKLFRYIIGVNSQQAEIKMTRPVTTIRQKAKGSPNMEDEVMCFWSGTPWADKNLPEPVDKAIFIQNRPELDVFVRRFGGWAMSQKDWTDEKQKLMRSLGSRMKEVDTEYYATVGYNSPWTQENRRNEVWLVKQTDTADLKQPETNKIPGGSSGYGEEKDLETIPFEVLETKQNYEIRQYPAAKWICNTNKNVIPSADPMNGWQQKYDNDPLKAMSSSAWKNQASSKMFMKLFKYISGANSMAEEVKMTTPVPTKHTSIKVNVLLEPQKEEQQMCFWLGTPWQNKKAPQPLGKDAVTTEVVQGKGIKVFVRKFGGFAMSQNDWHSQHDQLKSDLQQDGAKFKDNEEFYHLSYDSPWTMKNRRNEIWVEVE